MIIKLMNDRFSSSYTINLEGGDVDCIMNILRVFYTYEVMGEAVDPEKEDFVQMDILQAQEILGKILDQYKTQRVSELQKRMSKWEDSTSEEKSL